jgi:23S rRNA pseudouridine2457 synthase
MIAVDTLSAQPARAAPTAAPMPLIVFNKPFRVLTRFTDPDGRRTLADFLKLPGCYPAGRLDFDSEGVLLLTDDGRLRAAVTDPRHALEKIYWVQVEGRPTDEALERLRQGVLLADGLTRPARARPIEEPQALWPRDPPIRYRAQIPTAWLELAIREGRNRQVRRMTAAVGLPALRLVRAAVGPFGLEALAPGAMRVIDGDETVRFRARLLGLSDFERALRDGQSASRPRAPARSSGAGRRSSGRRARDRRR